MTLALGLLITTKHGGQLIGTAHTKKKTFEFTAQRQNLERLVPCELVTATAVPAGTADKISLQIQNFGQSTVRALTNPLVEYVRSGWKATFIEAASFAELDLQRDALMIAVPCLAPPAGFQGKRKYFEKLNWGADAVRLRWQEVPGCTGYRVSKIVVVKEKRPGSAWRTYQIWSIDVANTELLDADFKRESFKGASADTVYFVSAIGIGGFPGEVSRGITLGLLEKKDGWVPARAPVPPDAELRLRGLTSP